MVVATYDCDKRIDAVKQFARDRGGALTFIPGEIKHFKVNDITYRLGYDSDRNVYTIHDDIQTD